MKKIFFTILLICMCIFKVNASGMSFDLSCPTGASSSSTISCNVSISSTTSNPLCAIAAKLSINNGTYVSFDSKVSLFQNTKNGFTFNSDNNCISSKILFGTLKVKMPSSGNLTIKYSGIEASNASGTIKSTANDIQKTIKVYDSNNNLSSLSISNGTLTPSFNPNITSYSTNVESNIQSLTINAIPSSITSKITGSGTKTLSYGENKFTITVKSEDGSVKNYNIIVNRKDNRDTDNDLSSLSVTNHKLNETFKSNILNYSLTVKKDISNIEINATLNSKTSSFSKGYGPRKVDLKYGMNNIEIKVNAQNGKQKTYLIKVNREDGRSSNNFLKTLNISNNNINLTKDNLNYNISVKNDIKNVEIKAQSEDSKAIISGIGNVELEEGDNEIKINVEAENNDIRTYIINIKRLSYLESLSSNTYLSSLKISNYDISFSKDKLDYIIKINDENMLDIKAIAEDNTSTINIIGNNNIDDNSLIKINVSSQDGSIKTYNLIIDKNSNKSNIIYIIIIAIETLSIIILLFYSINSKKIRRDIKNEIN